MSIAPLYILGAKNTDHNKVRFVFIMPTPDSRSEEHTSELQSRI